MGGERGAGKLQRPHRSPPEVLLLIRCRREDAVTEDAWEEIDGGGRTPGA